MIGSKLLSVRRLKFYKYNLLFIIWLLIGCTAPLEENGTLTVLVTTTTETDTSLADSTPITASTEPLTMTPTADPTQLPIPTDTSAPPTQLPTPIVVPTLTKDEEGMLVKELMATNGGCQLPCWWGIQLGESLENIGNVFTNLGVGPWRVSASSFGNNGERGYIKMGYFNSTISAYNIDVSMDFYTVNEAVQFIEVSAERPFPQFSEEMFVQDWEKYSLSSILQTYSKPQYAYLIPQNVAEPGSPNFILILYYPDMGFKFSYQPYGTLSNVDELELCLNLENMRQINLALYNPEFVNNWSDYLLPASLNPEAEEQFNHWTWEAQTGMDLDTFFETYQAPSNLGCIQIP